MCKITFHYVRFDSSEKNVSKVYALLHIFQSCPEGYFMSMPGRFWDPGLMFDTPDLKGECRIHFPRTPQTQLVKLY